MKLMWKVTRELGRIGAGGVWEAGEESTGAGIPSWREAGEIRKNFLTLRAANDF